MKYLFIDLTGALRKSVGTMVRGNRTVTEENPRTAREEANMSRTRIHSKCFGERHQGNNLNVVHNPQVHTEGSILKTKNGEG